MDEDQRRRVWTFNFVLGVLGVAITFLPSSAPLASTHPRLWWCLPFVVMVALGEWMTVSFVFRSDSHTFSFVEIPITIGIAVLRGPWVVASVAAGLTLALLVHRHPPIRFVYNLAAGSLTTALAFLVASAIVPAHPSMSARWLGAAAAVVVSSSVSTQLVVGVRSLAAGAFQGQGVLRMAEFGALTSASSAAFGAIAGAAWSVSPVVAVLAVLPIVLLHGALRLYMTERLERSNVEFLYGATRVLQEAPVLEDGLADVLDRARTVFRTEHAEVAIRRGDGEWLRVHAGDRPRECNSNVLANESNRRFDGPVTVLTRRQSGDHPLLDALGARDAMVSSFVMRGGAAVGLLLVADRVGQPVVFDRTAQRQFGAFSAQIAVSLENGELEQSLDRLTKLGEDLRFQAHHDSLTGLGNRSLLRDHLDARCGETTVLVIDLDDFKVINDRLGHDAGDRVLVHIAEVLRSVVGERGVIARLGGDEFAIVLEDEPRDREALANRAADDRAADHRAAAHRAAHRAADLAAEIGDRILNRLREPIVLDGGPVTVLASIGVATQLGGDLAELLRNADAAMYESKRRGKGRTTRFPTDVAEIGTPAEVVDTSGVPVG